MRPRVFPAEDPGATAVRRRRLARFNEAAGIPRGRHSRRVVPDQPQAASMRPRVFPAEDPPMRVADDSAAEVGFNEAAGIPRGRPHLHPTDIPLQ